MRNPFGNPASPSALPRRTRPWVVVLSSLLVLAIVGAFFYRIFAAEYELRAAVAEADRTEPRWRLEDVEADRTVVPDAENSARPVAAAKHLFPEKWPFWDWPDAATDQSGGPPGAPDKHKALADGLQDLEPQRQLNDEQLTALHTEVLRAAEALAEARKLTGLTGGRHRITYSSDWISTRMPHLQDAREVCHLLTWDALVRAQDGDPDGALASCRAALNAGRSVGDEPFLISQLVRISCSTVAIRQAERVLVQGQPSEDALKALQQLLEKEESSTPLLTGIRGERAGLDAMMEAVASGRTTLTTRDLVKFSYFCSNNTLSPVEELELWQPGFLTAQRAAVLRYMNRAVELTALPAERRHEAFARLEATLPGQPVLVRRLVQALGKNSDACQRSQAQLRCALAATSAERYRRAVGRWPDTLDALTGAGYLRETPADPYDGKPLRWRRLDDGAEAYSIGPDGEDDGGKMDRKNPMAPGTDLGFRLWDPSRRRQPPVEDAGPKGK